jgi:hypothetical protein
MFKLPKEFYIETIHDNYTANDPVFFNTEDFEWCKRLEENAPAIIHCLQKMFDPSFSGLITNPETFQFPPKIWKAYPFYFNGFKINKHLREFPCMEEFLKDIPNLISASVSVLKPGSRLLPHNGNSNGVMRYHLGLKVPAQMPQCGFIIAGNEVSWEVGKSFMFCNMQVHSAHNLTNENRYILLLDVVRPEFTSIKKTIAIHTLARILTNNTANFFRNIFGVKPTVKSITPNKNELEYTANKTYSRKEKFIPKGIKQNLFHYSEILFLKFYILILTIVFAFKKMP